MYTEIAAVACLLAIAGEGVTMFVFGPRYPGYSQLKDTMSALGASASPVSAQMSAWWIIMGLLMVVFGTGIRTEFRGKGRPAAFASWLVILYGLGEGIGSGAFKADRLVNGLATSAIIHDAVGAVGVVAVLIFPLVMKRLIARDEKPFFRPMSRIIFVTGLLTVGFFLFRYLPDKDSILVAYKGLWQRLFMLNTYVYMGTVAVLMLVRRRLRS